MTTILPAAVRNAAFTAMEIATLAEVYPGRFTVGVGHGMVDWMRQVGALDRSPLSVLRENVKAIRSLLRAERVDLDGRTMHLDGVELVTTPRAVPPVLAGVRGPKSLRLSGEVADGTVLAEPVTPEYVRRAREHIATDQPHEVVAYNVCAVDDNPALALDRVRPALEWVGEPAWWPHVEVLDFAGELRSLRDQCATREEFARRLPGEWVERLAVAGDTAGCRRRLDGLAAAGVDTAVLVPVSVDPPSELASFATLLGS